MKNFITTILGHFPEIDFISLGRTSYKKIEINFDGEKDMRYENAKEAFHIIEKELGKEINGLIMFYSSNSKKLRKYKIEGIQHRGIDKIISKGEKQVYKVSYNSRFFLHMYWVENLDSIEIKKLLNGIVDVDFAIPPYLDFSVYFFKNDFSKIIEMCDDRGLYIVS